MGRSSLVPYHKNENPKDRHYRRLRTNLNWKDDLLHWARANSFRIDINNEGHHWILVKPEIGAERRPSSAKLVINQKWDKGIHCHDYRTLIAFLEEDAVNHGAEEE